MNFQKQICFGCGDCLVFHRQSFFSSLWGGRVLETKYYIFNFVSLELPPQILTEDGLLYSVAEGQTIDLACETFGSPRPNVTW